MINNKPLRWCNLNDINNTLRDIEEFYHNLRLEKIRQLQIKEANKDITDYELEFNISLYANHELIIEHTELLSLDKGCYLSGNGGLLDAVYLKDELFGNLEFDHENILHLSGELWGGLKGKPTQLTTEKPFCWLAHQITHDYNINVQTLLKTDCIWCDLVIREQVVIEFGSKESTGETFYAT